MRDLPRDMAASIYRRLYWQRPGFDKVALRAPRIAAELFDTGVNMGSAIAAGFLQRALHALNRTARDYPDIAVDRILGTSEERRVGKACVGTCKYRWWPYNQKKKK